MWKKQAEKRNTSGLSFYLSHWYLFTVFACTERLYQHYKHFLEYLIPEYMKYKLSEYFTSSYIFQYINCSIHLSYNGSNINCSTSTTGYDDNKGFWIHVVFTSIKTFITSKWRVKFCTPGLFILSLDVKDNKLRERNLFKMIFNKDFNR